VEFIPIPAVMEDMTKCNCNECEYMRMITLENLLNCIRYETGEIFVNQQVADDAVVSIQRMLEMS
jgi:quinolinate synthase